MKRITSLAVSAALLASLSTPVLAAPAISVDAAPTAAVLDEENSLWELPQADTPDMSNTVWSFAGGYIDGSEMTQAEMDESLAAYGGTLQFTFDAAGGAKMIQGGGTLNGTYQYLRRRQRGRHLRLQRRGAALRLHLYLDGRGRAAHGRHLGCGGCRRHLLCPVNLFHRVFRMRCK